jgi:hypothetical protein
VLGMTYAQQKSGIKPTFSSLKISREEIASQKYLLLRIVNKVRSSQFDERERIGEIMAIAYCANDMSAEAEEILQKISDYQRLTDKLKLSNDSTL